MSRHRNIRNRTYSYDDDLDDHDDYDATYPGSPSMEQFMYRRNSPSRNNSLFSFIDNPLDENVTENVQVDALVEKIQETLGGQHCSERVANELVNCNYNVEETINVLLDEPPSNRGVSPLAVFENTPKANKDSKLTLNAKIPLKQTSEKKAIQMTKPTATENVVVGMEGTSILQDPLQLASTEASVAVPTTTQLTLNEIQQYEKAEAKAQMESLKEMDDEKKAQINMVVIGHVDAGKSTLMGHLLHRLGYVSKKIIHKYEKESKEMGKASFAYAWVMDADEEERSRGCTMEVGVSYLETETKRVTLLDAPGHRDFIPKMIAGASQADVAILVVPSSTGEFEAAFENSGQTKEHTLLVRSLGVTQMIIAINKMDSVNWSKERFDEIRNSLSSFLELSGFRPKNLWFVPLSGITGDNLFTKLDSKLCPWYEGPTLTEAIDSFSPPVRPVNKPFRLSISDVFKTMSLGLAVSGRIFSGAISSGDKLLLMPSGQCVTLKAIERNSVSCTVAKAGDNVELGLLGVDQLALKIGDVLCSIVSPIKVVRKFQARIMTMPGMLVPIVKGACFTFHIHNVDEPVNVTKLISIVNNAGDIVKAKPRCIVKNSSAIVEISSPRSICLETFAEIRQLGRFTLRDKGVTVAAGIVNEIISN